MTNKYCEGHDTLDAFSQTLLAEVKFAGIVCGPWESVKFNNSFFIPTRQLLRGKWSAGRDVKDFNFP